jgi:UDP-glucose 4-epimerase
VPHDLVVANLTDRAAVAAALRDIDAVVHLAARPGVPDSVTDPAGTFDANVVQTVGLLEAVRAAGVPRFVFASSNAAVGQHEPPTDETSLPRPSSPYGASKLAGEAFTTAFAATYGIAACSLRFSNAYGPRSLHKRSVIATWIRAAIAGEPVTIFGDGEQTRDFIHVDDVAAAVVATLDAPVDAVVGEVFQIGTGRETTLNELAAAIGRAVGQPLAVRHAPARAGDVRRNVGRITKARERLGFSAGIDLDDGLSQTVAGSEWPAVTAATATAAAAAAAAALGRRE